MKKAWLNGMWIYPAFPEYITRIETQSGKLLMSPDDLTICSCY